MRKVFLAIVLMMFLFIVSACSEDEERSFTIDQVTIDAQIDEAGTIHVRELYTYTFDGSFKGVTRSVESDFQNFKAYLMYEVGVDPTIATDWLEPLMIEKDEENLQIYSASQDETKQVLYSYEVKDSVKKYQDVADLKYAFFDESNETDLHDVEITIHTPENIISEQTRFFLHGTTGEITAQDNQIVYTTDLLEAGESSMLRIIFPTAELSGMQMTKDEQMEEKILAAESELIKRKGQLIENMEKVSPMIWILIITVLVIAVMILIVHPNRYRGDKGTEHIIQLLEKTDPLFVSYLDMNGSFWDQSIIAALFSLKQRGIATLREVPSVIEEGETTFRFSWAKKQAQVDASDAYLRRWLFTEQDEEGNYFLIESLVQNEYESETVREEKAEEFEEKYIAWTELVEVREGYEDIRRPFKGYSILSKLLTIATFGVFYYFTKIDVISQTTQWVLPLIVAVLAVNSFVFSQRKWPVFLYYPVLIFMSLITFTIENATIFALFFYTISFLVLMIIRSTYWREDIRKIKYAMSKSYHLMKKNRYPVGSDPEIIEKRLEYAMILDVGETYAKQCGREEHMNKLNKNYPLLMNPTFAAETFNPSNLALYSMMDLDSDSSTSSSSSSSSSTGGGGAGAF